MLSDVGQSITALRRHSLNCPSTLTQTVRQDCDSFYSLSSPPMKRLPPPSFTSITLLVEIPWRQSPFRPRRHSLIRPSSPRLQCNEPDRRSRKQRRVNRRHQRSKLLLRAQKARASLNNQRAAMVCTRAMPPRLCVGIDWTDTTSRLCDLQSEETEVRRDQTDMSAVS